jgi:hypothetical protein
MPSPVKSEATSVMLRAVDEALAHTVLQIDTRLLGICPWRSMVRCLMSLDLPAPSEALAQRVWEANVELLSLAQLEEASRVETLSTLLRQATLARNPPCCAENALA